MEERVNYDYKVDKVIKEIKRANKEAVKKHKHPFILNYKFYGDYIHFTCDYWQKASIEYAFVKLENHKPYGAISVLYDEGKKEVEGFALYDSEIKFFHRLAQCIKK